MKAIIWNITEGCYLAEIEHDDTYVPHGTLADIDPALAYRVISRGKELCWNDAAVYSIISSPDFVCDLASDFRCFVISDEQFAAFAGEAAAQEQAEITAEIAEIDAKLDGVEREALPTYAEAQEARRRWMLTYNEGGEGYVPSMLTREAYDRLRARRAELTQKTDPIITAPSGTRQKGEFHEEDH